VHDGFYRPTVTRKQYFFEFDASNVPNNYPRNCFLFLCFENEGWASRDILERVNFNKVVISNNYNMIWILKCREMDEWDWASFVTTEFECISLPEDYNIFLGYLHDAEIAVLEAKRDKCLLEISLVFIQT